MRGRRREEEKKEWIPKTSLGKRVIKGEAGSLDDILERGEVILEPEIVDARRRTMAEEKEGGKTSSMERGYRWMVRDTTG